MQKTIVTKLVFNLLIQTLKILAKRTDNKIDDALTEYVEQTYNK